jgi:hypothetical protein
MIFWLVAYFLIGSSIAWMSVYSMQEEIGIKIALYFIVVFIWLPLVLAVALQVVNDIVEDSLG